MCDHARSSDHYEGRFDLPSRREAFTDVERTLLSELERHAYPQTAIFAIRLAFEEAISNAVTHGNAENEQKIVRVRLEVGTDRVMLDVADEGEGFDPQSVPDPTADENIDIPSGRGLMLIRSFMTDIEIIPPGNRIRMIYAKPGPE